MRLLIFFAALVACLAQEDRAKEFVDLLVKGDFTRAETMFDATMKSAVSPDKLGAIWQSLTAQLGTFKRVIASRQETKGEYLNVYETCEFGATNFDLIVTFDKQGQIAGFHATTASYVPTGDKPPAGVIELPVKVAGLAGALAVPQSGGPFPALVLVHGSGPQDRDETIGRNKPFRDLAWGLASRGIAVLRYDKRKNLSADATVKQETIDDAVAAALISGGSFHWPGQRAPSKTC